MAVTLGTVLSALVYPFFTGVRSRGVVGPDRLRRHFAMAIYSALTLFVLGRGCDLYPGLRRLAPAGLMAVAALDAPAAALLSDRQRRRLERLVGTQPDAIPLEQDQPRPCPDVAAGLPQKHQAKVAETMSLKTAPP